MLKRIIKLILIIGCMLLIFVFSTDNGEESSGKSDGLIIKISEIIGNKKITKKDKAEIIDKYVVLVRKGAHFIIYLTLGLLIISFLKEFMVVNYKTVLLAVFLTFLYACSDEIHQLYVAGRSGEVKDVLLDTAGATIGCLIYSLFYKIRRKFYE